MPRYPFAEVERRWQREWAERGTFSVRAQHWRPKTYVFCAAPFATGNMHIGHVRSYTLADVHARYRRMHGDNVLVSMGFETFGLPTELAAAAAGRHPADWSDECVRRMSEQMVSVGLGIDWDRCYATSDPEIFGRTQRLFLELLEAGYVYRTTARVNWCPKCETTLANRQIEEASGACWRCGTEVEGRRLAQWFFRMTAFADPLDRLLDDVDWPTESLRLLRQWYGRHRALSVELTLDDGTVLACRTPRPEALPLAGFVAVSPDHPLAAGAEELADRLGRVAPAAAGDEELASLTGRYAVEPLTGRRIPVVAAAFLADAGPEQAVLGVPSADAAHARIAQALGVGDADGPAMSADDVVAEVRARGLGDWVDAFRVKDWLVSRQRSWGTPIPVVHCESCGLVPLPAAELPLGLPDDLDLAAGKGLADCPSFVETTCPRCAAPARRETDTLDCIGDIFWNYVAPASPAPADGDLVDRRELEYWMPVDVAFYGTDILRFTANHWFFLLALNALGYVDETMLFKRAVHHGMVLADSRKMSKSSANFVEPREVVAQAGADALRLAVLGAAQPRYDFNWSPRLVQRSERLLDGLWELVEQSGRWPAVSETLLRAAPERWRSRAVVAVDRITDAMESHSYHLAVDGLSAYVGWLEKIARGATRPAEMAFLRLATLVAVRMAAPLAPHLADELSERLGTALVAGESPWPAPAELAEELGVAPARPARTSHSPV